MAVLTFITRGGNCLLEDLECYKHTQMKAYDITKLIAKLNISDNVQYRNKLEGHSVERVYLRQSCSDGSR